PPACFSTSWARWTSRASRINSARASPGSHPPPLPPDLQRRPGVRAAAHTAWYPRKLVTDHYWENDMQPTSVKAPRAVWTWVAASVAVFMVSMDNLVVTNALPVIRVKLAAGLEGLEWTVNAYTLSFAVFLLTGAALGDRFGRRRLFAIGLSIFTLASAAAAMAPNIGVLVAARAVQGVGRAIAMPLTLTLLASVVPPARRGLAFGIWGATGGLGVALGPVIGGAITQYSSWQWIFWVNVPIGLLLLPVLALVR